MNERQAFAAIRNAIRLENLSASLAAPVSKQLREIFDELGEQFRLQMPSGNIERELWYRQQRLRIADMLAPLSQEAYADLSSALGEEVQRQMDYAQSYLEAAADIPENQLAIIAPQDGVSVLRDTSKVQFTRQQLATIAEDTQVLGDRLGDLFRPSLDSAGKAGKWIEQNIGLIDRKVKTGFLTGMTNDQIAATLPGLGREAVARNKAIARTAVMDMSARSQEALWAANSDRIKGWEYDATMDNRVCDICAPWDGEFKEARGQLPVVPLHVNCRCRVLPLTATELALREKEGPQRRSVVELVNAPSKEAAIAQAKLKPGAKEARAYAKQVTVKGKKYWRVAVDIERKGGPLTMGEFLKQATPETQKQVLGSEKRRSQFLKLVAGSDRRPPISPERALKEVVEWRPTVSRKPRMSAQMRLDISKLKSQKELMKKNSEGEQHIVYGYLDKEGKPYYIGIGKSGRRPFSPHLRARGSVPIPAEEELVRQFGVFPDRKSAARRELRLIQRYGRKGLDPGGVLMNVKEGGGQAVTAETRKKLAALRSGRPSIEAARFGLPDKVWKSLTRTQKARVRYLFDKGIRGEDLLSTPSLRSEANVARLRESASKVGVSYEKWRALSPQERGVALKRYRAGLRGDQVLADIDPQMFRTAQKYEVPYEIWARLTAKDRGKVSNRFRRGKRGAELLAGIA